MERELFPREVTGSVPLLTLTGCDHLRVEQHRGVVAYGPEEIILRTAVGQYVIQGKGLCFRTYTTTEAVVAGQIDGLFCRGAGGRS